VVPKHVAVLQKDCIILYVVCALRCFNKENKLIKIHINICMYVCMYQNTELSPNS
jgi:hypothetical protein